MNVIGTIISWIIMGAVGLFLAFITLMGLFFIGLGLYVVGIIFVTGVQLVFGG